MKKRCILATLGLRRAQETLRARLFRQRWSGGSATSTVPDAFATTKTPSTYVSMTGALLASASVALVSALAKANCVMEVRRSFSGVELRDFISTLPHLTASSSGTALNVLN